MIDNYVGCCYPRCGSRYRSFGLLLFGAVQSCCVPCNDACIRTIRKRMSHLDVISMHGSAEVGHREEKA